MADVQVPVNSKLQSAVWDKLLEELSESNIRTDKLKAEDHACVLPQDVGSWDLWSQLCTSSSIVCHLVEISEPWRNRSLQLSSDP